MAYLELENLTKHFKRRTGMFSPPEIVKAVDGIDLSINKGEILGLVGESGCGKSTISRLIMQLLRPTEGSVILEGERLAELSAREVRTRRPNFQMIFQDPYASLNPRMTIYSTIAEAVLTRHPEYDENFVPKPEKLIGKLIYPYKVFVLRILRIFKRKGNQEKLTEAVSELMEKVGLDPRYIRKYPHEFSGGQRQRIAIARALATEPKLIIADEPVSSLDVSIQSQILNLLRHLQRDLNLTMIFVTHDLSVVRYIADRIAVMEDGKIVELGEAEALFENPRSESAKVLLSAIPKIQF